MGGRNEVSLDAFKGHVRRRTLPNTPMEALVHANPFEEPAQSRLELDTVSRVVDEAVADLNELDKQIVLARVFERLTIRAIARRFSISVGKAHYRLMGALAELEDTLSQESVVNDYMRENGAGADTRSDAIQPYAA